uniref:Uncharacterized protein n=1 Tax=Globodera rostochiensis TaxID=31243 RepID=A0A914I6X0_GLORO
MSSKLQALTKQLNEDLELLQKELKKIEAENETKQSQFANEQNLLMEARTESELQQRKLQQLKDSLVVSEKALTESKSEFDNKQEQLNLLMRKYRMTASKRNEKFKMALQIMRRVTIKEEDQYGNMEEYKRAMQQQIAEFKSEIALGQQELKTKRDELTVLEKEFASSVDQPAIGPELKREISEHCIEALKCQRKQLVETKMLNHNMRFKLTC